MKHYAMASISSPSIIKQPLRALEIPLSKFADEVIPHHQKILDQHKQNMNRLIALNNTEQIAKEVVEKKRAIKQLRDLLYELDTLRTQVEDGDLDAFDSKTIPLRSSILKLTKAYQDLEKAVDRLLCKDNSPEEVEDERRNPFEGAAHIRIEGNIQELKLKEEQDRHNKVKEIQKKTEDLQEIYNDLHVMVKDQGEQVIEVEEAVTNTEGNVNQGFKDIVRAHKLYPIAYPATGAFFGTLLGGPIGLIAGLKVGGVAALGCAFAGYAGGKMIKKQLDNDINDAEHVINNENNENQVTVTNKKDV